MHSELLKGANHDTRGSVPRNSANSIPRHSFRPSTAAGRSQLFPKRQTIFAQGDSSDAVFYIQKGKVKLTVVSKSGKEATIGILNEGDFFGEGCLTGQPLRLCSATAMTDCSVMRIEKKSMMEVLHREHAFSDMFVAYLLTRNIRYEEDLVDQLFNSSEKRLARDICCCWLISARKESPRSANPQNQSGRLSQRWWAQLARGLAFS